MFGLRICRCCTLLHNKFQRSTGAGHSDSDIWVDQYLTVCSLLNLCKKDRLRQPKVCFACTMNKEKISSALHSMLHLIQWFIIANKRDIGERLIVTCSYRWELIMSFSSKKAVSRWLSLVFAPMILGCVSVFLVVWNKQFPWVIIYTNMNSTSGVCIERQRDV